MQKIRNQRAAAFLRGVVQIGALVLLATLWIAPLALAESEADAPSDTNAVPDKAMKEKAETDTARTSPDTSAVPDKAMKEKAETDTARTSPRNAELDKTLSEMKARLKLTRVQEMYIRSILKESLEKQRALREKTQGQGRRNTRSSMQELREQQEQAEKRIEEVLTEEQVREYRKFKEEQQEKRQQEARQRRGRRR